MFLKDGETERWILRAAVAQRHCDSTTSSPRTLLFHADNCILLRRKLGSKVRPPTLRPTLTDSSLV